MIKRDMLIKILLFIIACLSGIMAIVGGGSLIAKIFNIPFFIGILIFMFANTILCLTIMKIDSVDDPFCN